MSTEAALIIFVGLAALAGAIVYFALGVNRTADEVNAIRTSGLGQLLFGWGGSND